MYRIVVVIVLVLEVGAAAFGANVKVNVNGKTTPVPAVESNGKAYLDVVSLMKLLGMSAVYNASTHSVTIKQAGAGAAGAGGVSQLAGEYGQLGKLYAISKDKSLLFSLDKAEYTPWPVIAGERIVYAKANQKLLLLTFTVQNATKRERLFRHDTIRFTAVDDKDNNHESVYMLGDSRDNSAFSAMLKPAQKVKVYMVVPVPAKNLIPKLMMLTGPNDPVIRYDLRGNTGTLQAPFADPADETGSTLLETVPAATGTAYPLRFFSVNVTKTEYASGALDAQAPQRGGRFFIVTMNVKNITPTKALLRHDTFQYKLASSEGQPFRYMTLLLPVSNTRFNSQIEPGQEQTVRAYFEVPQGASASTLVINENDSRGYSYSF